MKTIGILAFFLLCGPCFAQDLVVRLTEEEEEYIDDLDDPNATYLFQVLSDKKIVLVKGSSPVGSVGYIHALSKKKRNRGIRTADSQSKAGIVIDEILDDNNAIANGYRWWLEGFDTTRWNAGKKENASLQNVVIVKHEDRSFVTDAGRTKRVQHFVRVDVEPAEDLIESILESRDLHLFYDKSRQKRFIGLFLEMEDGKVSIKTAKGRTVRVPVRNLSFADQQWIKYQ